eukprot:Amastigsp_a177214_12.p2 type:complete len:192 gc:universal Amastigsp_a177214_12:114-689(+)
MRWIDSRVGTWSSSSASSWSSDASSAIASSALSGTRTFSCGRAASSLAASLASSARCHAASWSSCAAASSSMRTSLASQIESTCTTVSSVTAGGLSMLANLKGSRVSARCWAPERMEIMSVLSSSSFFFERCILDSDSARLRSNSVAVVSVATAPLAANRSASYSCSRTDFSRLSSASRVSAARIALSSDL